MPKSPSDPAENMLLRDRNEAEDNTADEVSGRFSKLLAIVPALNEASSIEHVIGDIRSSAPDFDIVVVDDGSTDATATLARQAGARVLSLPFNLGIGGAVQCGFTYAMENGYDIAVQVDGDGQHQAAALTRLVEELLNNRADVVVGSRYLGAKEYKAPFVRRLGMVALSYLISAIVRRKITDPTSGLRAYNRKAIAFCARNYPGDYPEPEVIPLMARAGLRLVEVPVAMSQRHSGQSSITWSRAFYYMVKVTLAIFIGVLRQSGVEE